MTKMQPEHERSLILNFNAEVNYNSNISIICITHTVAELDACCFFTAFLCPLFVKKRFFVRDRGKKAVFVHAHF